MRACACVTVRRSLERKRAPGRRDVTPPYFAEKSSSSLHFLKRLNQRERESKRGGLGGRKRQKKRYFPPFLERGKPPMNYLDCFRGAVSFRRFFDSFCLRNAKIFKSTGGGSPAGSRAVPPEIGDEIREKDFTYQGAA